MKRVKKMEEDAPVVDGIVCQQVPAPASRAGRDEQDG